MKDLNKIIFDLPQNFDESFNKDLIDTFLYFDTEIKSANMKNKKLEIYTSSNDFDNLKKKVKSKLSEFLSTKKRFSTKVLYNSNNKAKNNLNPFKELSIKDQIKYNSEMGGVIYSGLPLKIIKIFDRTIKSNALDLGASEELYTPLVTSETLLSAKYLENFPHHAIFATPLKRDAKKYSEIKEKIRNGKTFSTDFFAYPTKVLSPTICYRFFESNKNQSIPNNKLVTAFGHCFRNEGFNTNFIDRLDCFLMREIIFIGEKNKNLILRNKFLSIFKNIFNKLGFEYFISTATDPFFFDPNSQKENFQLIDNTKLEMQFHIPFLNKTASVVSINNHQSSIVNSLNISFKEKKEITSFCIGIGYDRLVLAAFAQFGSYIQDWPKELIKFLS